jgi:response regulator RpfG family c-di-GMP phosphodiesterase
MARHLTSQGHCVCEADDADKALEYLKTICFDVVIADYKLHGSNGIDVLSYVHWFAPSTRKLLITGFPADEIRAVAEQIGAA